MKLIEIIIYPLCAAEKRHRIFKNRAQNAKGCLLNDLGLVIGR